MKFLYCFKICFLFLFLLLNSNGLLAQFAGPNCNSAPLINIPTNGSEVEIIARFDQYSSASYQGQHPCVGIDPPYGSGPDVWFKFVANDTKVIMLEQIGGVGIFLYRGTCGQLTIKDYISNGNGNAACVGKSSHAFDTQIGETYYVQISFYGPQFDYPIFIQNQSNAANQDCATAQMVQVADGFENGVFVSSEQFSTSNIPSSGCATGTKDGWYSFVAPDCGGVEYFSPGQGTIYGGTCASLQILECFSENGTLTGLVPGQIYFMQFMDDPTDPYVGEFFIQPYVDPNPPISNTSCANATAVNLNQLYSGNSLSSVALNPTNSCEGNIVAKSVWFSFTAPTGVTVNTFTNGAISELYSGNCGSLAQESCVTDGIYSGLTSGNIYYLKLLFNSDYNSNNFNLEISTPITGQTCENPQSLSVGSGSCNNASYNLDINFKTDPCITLPNTWLSFTAPTSGSIKIDCSSNGYFYNLYNNDCNNLNTIAQYQGEENVHFIHGLITGQSYLLSIGKNNVSSPLEFCVEANTSTASNSNCNNANNITSNTAFAFESGKAVLDLSTSNGVCELDSAMLWYSFSATSADMIFSDPSIVHELYSGTCGSLTSINEINFGEDAIYENLNVGNSYYLKLSTGTINDINASLNVSIDDYIKVSSGHGDCASALLVSLSNTSTAYDLGVPSSLSAVPLPSCISSGTGLADNWMVFNAINNGLYLENVLSSDTYVLYSGACGSLNEMACYSGVENNFIQFGNLVSGNQFYLRKIVAENEAANSSIASSQTAANADCGAAISIAVTQEGNSSNALSSNKGVSFQSVGSCDSKISLWYQFTAPAGGNVILQEHVGDVAVYEENCATLTEVFCGANSGGSSLSIDLTPGSSYKLRLSFDEYNSDDRSFVLIAGTPSTPETNCSQAPILPLSDITCNQAVSSSTTGVILSSGNFCGASQRRALFYQFTANSDASFRFEVSNAAAAHAFSIFEDCTLAQPYACGNSPLDVNLTNGTNYIIAVYAQDENNGSSFDLCAYISPQAADGNVGISVSNPQAKLDVNGGIKAGNTNNEIPGVIRWNNDLEVYDGTAWKSTTAWDHIATQDIDLQNNRIQNAADPLLPSDVATKAYVDQFPNNDNSPSNEIQNLNLSNDTLKLTLTSNFITFDTYYDNELITDFDLANDNTLSISEPGNSYSLDLTKYDNGWNYNTATDELTYELANVGVGLNNPQVKLDVNGGIRPGNTLTELPGVIRWNNDLEVYDGSEWKSATEWDQIATQDIDMQNNRIRNALDPLLPSDVATKAYVDQIPVSDPSPTNEIQTLTLLNDQLQLSLGGGMVQFDTYYDNELITNFNLANDNTLSITEAGSSFPLDLTKYDNGWLYNTGTQELTYDAANVGIKDSDPSQSLSVTGTVRASNTESETEYLEIKNNGTEGIINSTGSGNLSLEHDGDTKLSVTPSGNIGIGDEAPSAKLSVSGKIRSSNSDAETELIELSHDGVNAQINTAGGGNLYFQHDSNTKMTIQDDGNVGIGNEDPSTPLAVVGTMRASNTDAETELIEIEHDGINALINTEGDGNLFFQHDSDTKMTIKDDGNVGIGITNPLADLHISGGLNEQAILFNNDLIALQHGSDLLNSKIGGINFLIDSDANSGADNFSIYNNVASSTGQTPKISLGLEGQDSYINLGQLGLGVTNPNDKLHIQSAVGENALRVQVGTATKFRIFANGSIALGSNTTSITDNNIYVATNLGIGDPNPSERLSVVGKVRASANSTELEFNEFTHDGSNGIINTQGDGDLLLQHDGTTVLAAEDSGQVGIGTTNPSDRLEILADAGEDAFRVRVGGSTKFRIYDNGSIALGTNITSISDNDVLIANNLGIGDSSPDAKLSVVGNVRASAASNELDYVQMNHDGTNGYISVANNAGNLNFQAPESTTRMTISRFGNIGIRETSPTSTLHVNGQQGINKPAFRVDVEGNSKFLVDDNGYVEVTDRMGFGISSPTYRLEIPNSPTTWIGRARANAWVTYSDQRVKMNIQNLDYGLKEVLQLRPTRYDHHSSTFDNGNLELGEDFSNEIGFIAQEVAAIIEEVVTQPENEKEDLWAMNYEQLTPVLVNAIKELAERNSGLADKIGGQQTQIEDQKSLLSDQAALIKQLLEAQDEMKASLQQLEASVGIK